MATEPTVIIGQRCKRLSPQHGGEKCKSWNCSPSPASELQKFPYLPYRHPSTGRSCAPISGLLIVGLIPVLLACSPSMCRKCNHSYHGGIFWLHPRRISWTKDFCSIKSGCISNMWAFQHESVVCFLLHFPQSFSCHIPCSFIMALIPFVMLRVSEWSCGKTIGWMTFWPSRVYQPSHNIPCFPPGFTFIQDTNNVSGEYAECPCELLTIIKAW